MSGGTAVALMIESDGPGGAERMLLHLAEGLRERGHDICPILPANGCGWLAGEFRKAGFEPEVFRLRRAIDPGCVRGLGEVFRRRGVDVVHSHEFTMAFYGAAAARLSRLPHVITMHGGTGFAERWRRRAALRWAFRRSDAAVTVSRSSRTSLAEALGISEAALDVVPNGIAFAAGDRTAARARLGLEEDETLILAVGNLYPVKGHAVLLRALAAMNGAAGRWRVAVAGRGAEEEGLRSYAEGAGIASRVELLGYRADVPELLAAADVYVMPSLSEGLPLALVEAMFAGKPVIASRVGGIPEVVEHGETGLLVPPRDPDALAEALRCLLVDPSRARALGEAAREAARSRYGLGPMTDAYRRLYAAAADARERQ